MSLCPSSWGFYFEGSVIFTDLGLYPRLYLDQSPTIGTFDMLPDVFHACVIDPPTIAAEIDRLITHIVANKSQPLTSLGVVRIYLRR